MYIYIYVHDCPSSACARQASCCTLHDLWTCPGETKLDMLINSPPCLNLRLRANLHLVPTDSRDQKLEQWKLVNNYILSRHVPSSAPSAAEDFSAAGKRREIRLPFMSLLERSESASHERSTPRPTTT